MSRLFLGLILRWVRCVPNSSLVLCRLSRIVSGSSSSISRCKIAGVGCRTGSKRQQGFDPPALLQPQKISGPTRVLHRVAMKRGCDFMQQTVRCAMAMYTTAVVYKRPGGRVPPAFRPGQYSYGGTLRGAARAGKWLRELRKCYNSLPPLPYFSPSYALSFSILYTTKGLQRLLYKLLCTIVILVVFLFQFHKGQKNRPLQSYTTTGDYSFLFLYKIKGSPLFSQECRRRIDVCF